MTTPTEDAVYQAGAALGASPKAMLAAFETIIVESGAKNLASKAVPESIKYPNEGVRPGDYDSVGAFQQRAGWGSIKSRMNVRESAERFFRKAKSHEKEAQSAGQLAQSVQVSAYPARYDNAKASATSMLAAAAGRNKGSKGLLDGLKDGVMAPLDKAKEAANTFTQIPQAIQGFTNTLEKQVVSAYVIGVGVVMLGIGFYLINRTTINGAVATGTKTAVKVAKVVK